MMTRRSILSGLVASASTGAVVDAAAQSDREFHVYMILFRGWESACDGFRDYLLSRNIRVKITVYDLDQDIKKAPVAVDLVRQAKPDLVFVWGTSTAIAVLGPWDKPDPKLHLVEFPVVFCIVTDPVANGVVKSSRDPGRNATGVEYVAPLDVQLRAMALYRPVRKVGIVFNPREQNSVSVVRGLEALGPGFGFELVTLPVRTSSGGGLSANELPDRVHDAKRAGADWIYIPPDTLLNLNRDALTNAALDLKLPAFSSAERFIRESYALCGLVSRYWSVGAFAGFKAEQILLGVKSAQQLPVEMLARFSYLVRLDTAKRLGLAPPLKVMKVGEFV
jgi:putative ABC transport system substrate-binding protein